MDQPSYHPRQGTKPPSKLDSFKGQIAALLERHPYTAQQLFQQLRHQGYAGGYTILKEFVRQVRPARKPAFLMLESAPGECAQVDWGNFGSRPGLAAHYGFQPVACNVRKANEKGRVENGVGYVKKNFLNGLDSYRMKDQLNP